MQFSMHDESLKALWRFDGILLADAAIRLTAVCLFGSGRYHCVPAVVLWNCVRERQMCLWGVSHPPPKCTVHFLRIATGVVISTLPICLTTSANSLSSTSSNLSTSWTSRPWLSLMRNAFLAFLMLNLLSLLLLHRLLVFLFCLIYSIILLKNKVAVICLFMVDTEYAEVLLAACICDAPFAAHIG